MKFVQVVLQRDISEIYSNNYNPEWLQLWDANMDLAPVKDFFGVITYITEYAFKPEPQELAIRKALEACKDEDVLTRMKVIATSFQDNRQMGEAEACYQVLPELNMTMSNVAKQWVCLDRDEDRTKRTRKAQKKDIDEGRDVFEMEGMEGSWIESWDMRSKYMRRDKLLYNMSFAHFARMMESAPKSKKEEDSEEEKAKKEKKSSEAAKKKNEAWYAPFHMVMECSHMCCTDKPKEDCDGGCCKGKRSKLKRKPKKTKELPDRFALSEPYAGEAKEMKKRKIPAVLRFYKANAQKNPFKFFLQELLLFVPFGLAENGDTKDLLTHSDDKIAQLYDKYQEHIREVKSQVLPFLEDVTEQRHYAEEVNRQINLEEIAAEVAPGKEDDNMKTLEADVPEGGDFVAVDPELLENGEEHVRISDYGRIIIPDKMELIRQTRRLDPEQRRVLDIAVGYAKKIKRARVKGKRFPDPPHLMVHGPAGTGNNFEINYLICADLVRSSQIP